MTDYDPFERGEHPVGVQSANWNDPGRDRTLPVEIWYPATAEYEGQDRDPEHQDQFEVLDGFPDVRQAAVRDAERAEGTYPVILFSHGYAGHRRQSTALCTHWASHGYLVAALDHVGNTTTDLLNVDPEDLDLSEEERLALAEQFARDRPRDVIFLLNSLLEEEWGDFIDPERVGMSGHSFGGWTTLMVTAQEPRVDAALPMAPAGGPSPLYDEEHPIPRMLELNWDRPVPVLYLAAELDSLISLEGVRTLVERTPEPVRLLVLNNADHFHFCNSVEEIHELFRSLLQEDIDFGLGAGASLEMQAASRLCPGEHGHAFMKALGLAHMDAHVKESGPAGDFLQQDLVAVFADRGIDVDEG